MDRNMSPRTKQLVSAQVALKSASGKPFPGQSPITTANIADYAPAADTVTAAAARFREAGFEVANLGGNSFSITAPRSAFEKFFKMKLRSEDSGGMKVAATRGVSEGYELPLQALPQDLSQLVAAVTFTPPPDFGPTSY